MKNISLGFKRAVVVVALLGVMSMVMGCRNTARGVGQDMERTGEKIQEKTQ
jgi:predicted small secreted protein